MILPCTCYHAFQNQYYGQGQRVHNFTPKGYTNGKPGWRCTVCARVKPASRGEATEATESKRGNE